jgi:hypothetical protein
MSVGGFGGFDPAPTLQQFQGYVAAGKVHYFFVGDRGRPGGRERSPIAGWVQDTFTPVDIGGQTLYDLTRPVH